MTMVYESRKVVEDYVLFKIKDHMHANSNGDVSDHSQQRLTVRNYAHFPLPQEPPGDINKAVRKVANDYERLYRRNYPDMLEGIRANHISAGNVDKVFSRIIKELFKLSNGSRGGNGSVTSSPSGGRKSKTPSPALVDPNSDDDSIEDTNIKWSHVIGLLVFTGVLAVRCVEINQYEQVDDIVNWVTKFLDTKLRRWLRRQGGWNGFVQWSQRGGAGGATEQNELGAGMRTALRVGGAVAAVAFTAMMISRK